MLKLTMAKANKDLSEEDQAFLEAVEEGLADLDAGRTVPYERVRKWLLSWGSENELEPPE